MLRATIILLLHLAVSINALAQEKFSVIKDLRAQWLIFEQDQFKPLKGEDTESIYVAVELARYAGNDLMIRSSKEFFLFIDGKLVKQYEGALTLSVDSLAAAHTRNNLWIGVYQKKLLKDDLKTFIISREVAPADDVQKPNLFFRDFITIAGLIVIVFFVAMIRIHPKLASDYFSVARILSLREADDTQLNSRFALSSNILFYIFSSLLAGLCLLVLFYNLPDDYTLPYRFTASSFWGAVFQWLRLSFFILCVLFAKVFLIYTLSNLFGLRNVAGIHFFNWVRLLLVVAGAVSVIIFIYYISRGYNASVYLGFLTVIVVVIAGWNILAFLKLNNRVEHSMFHLFSYICATEIIPLLITIRILFQ